MNEPTVTISLREFNELKDALRAAVMFRRQQIDKNKNHRQIEEWKADEDRWHEMLCDYNEGVVK